MERLTHKRASGIKSGYWSPNKKDELVQRLAEYENTGMDPEKIAKLKEQAENMYTHEQVQEAINMATQDALNGYTDNIVSDYLP